MQTSKEAKMLDNVYLVDLIHYPQKKNIPGEMYVVLKRHGAVLGSLAKCTPNPQIGQSVLLSQLTPEHCFKVLFPNAAYYNKNTLQ